MNIRTPCRAYAVIGLVFFLTPALASGQRETDLGSRRVLLESAESARASGDHARALDLANRAGAIQMSPSVRLFVTEELLALGRLAQAYGSSDACIREAERDTAARNRETILSRCRTLRAEVRSRLGFVIVQVPEALRGRLRVRVGADEVPVALWGVPSVVTPGRVRIVADEGGATRFDREVVVAVGATETVQVSLEARAGSTAGAQGSSSSDSGSTATPTGATQSDPASTGVGVSISTPSATSAAGAARGISPGPFVLLGVGGAGLLASGVFALLRGGALADCTILADAVECSNANATQRAMSQAPMLTTLTNVAWIAGATVGVAGIVWLVVDRLGARAPAERRAQLVLPFFSPQSIGIVGSF